MIFKVLVFVLVMSIVYFLFFKKARVDDRKTEYGKQKKAQELDGETMVECKKCSTFVSPKEAVIRNGNFYCSNECAFGE
jgi:uncharacterized protein